MTENNHKEETPKESAAQKQAEESMTEEDSKFITELAGQTNSPISSQTLVKLLDAYTLIGKSYSPQVPLEIALFELLQ